MITLQFILYNLTFLLVIAHFLDSAKEQGDVWLMFYFHFLKNLYEAANSQQREVSTIHDSLAKKPANTLKALQMLKDKYKEICPNEINAIEHVIEVMEGATAKK